TRIVGGARRRSLEGTPSPTPIHLTKVSEAAHEHARPRVRTSCEPSLGLFLPLLFDPSHDRSPKTVKGFLMSSGLNLLHDWMLATCGSAELQITEETALSSLAPHGNLPAVWRHTCWRVLLAFRRPVRVTVTAFAARLAFR